MVGTLSAGVASHPGEESGLLASVRPLATQGLADEDEGAAAAHH